MSRFLTLVPVEKAVSVAISIVTPVPDEVIPLDQAWGRVLAGRTVSDIDIPGFTRSTVDGYAVRASDTTGASDAIPAIMRCTGSVRMGSPPDRDVIPDTCVYVPTGGMIPGGADAVVMIEYCETAGGDVLVKRPVAQGENLVRQGEDFSAGAAVLEPGRRIGGQEMGVLAATGSKTVKVRRQPVVGIISSGNEVVGVDEVPGPAQVRDANSYLCTGFVREYGMIPRMFGVCHDDAESLGPVIKAAVQECDAVLLSGGSSKDDRDLTARMIAGIGEVLVHGIALAPGKPTIIGRAGAVPLIGLPGHPASAFVVLHAIAGPMFTALSGAGAPRKKTLTGVLAEGIPSARGREDYVRVRVEGSRVYPLFGKSGLLNTLVRSDGLVRIPSMYEGIEAGETVEVILW
jgi:molybdopterin molybdotransferase